MLLRKVQYLQRSGNCTLKHSADDPSTPLSPVAVPAQKQLKYSAGIVNSPSKGITALNKEQLKVLSDISLSVITIIVS
jgi:kinesin family protein 4/21/27